MLGLVVEEDMRFEDLKDLHLRDSTEKKRKLSTIFIVSTATVVTRLINSTKSCSANKASNTGLGTDLRVHSPQHLLAIENELNRRPRRVIQDCTPTELFESRLTSSHVNCCNDD